MTLEIAKITNKKLRELAHQCNTKDADYKTLNDEEFGIFYTKANALKGVSLNAKEQAFNLNTTNPIGDSVEIKTEETPTTQETAKVEEEKPKVKRSNAENVELLRREDVIEAKIAELVDANVTMEGIVEYLEKYYSNYAEIIADVKIIKDAIDNLEINGKEDIKKIRKNLGKENLEYKNGERLFHYDIIGLLIKAKKNEQVAKEAEKYQEYFEEWVKNNPTLNAGLHKDAILEYADKRLNEDLKNKIIKNESYYKDEARDLFVKELNALVAETVQDFTVESKGQTAKEIKTELHKKGAVTATVGQDGQTYKESPADSISATYRKAVRENKDDRELVARYNKFYGRMSELKNVTIETLKKEFKNKTILQELNRNYIKPGTTEYDFTEFAKIIEERQGTDFQVSQSKNIGESELELIKQQFALKLSIPTTDLSDEETIDLIEFCGGTYEENDKSGKTALSNAADRIIPGAITGLSTGKIINIEQTNYDVYSEDFANKLTNLYKSQGKTPPTFNKLEDGRYASVDNIQKVTLETFGINTLISVGVEFALEFLRTIIIGDPKCFEIAFVSIDGVDFKEYKTLDELEQYWKNENIPEQNRNTLMNIAKFCVDEEGNYSPEKFHNLINHIAGLRSNLNPEEIRGFQLKNEAVKEILKLEEPVKTTITRKPLIDTSNNAIITRTEIPQYIEESEETPNYYTHKVIAGQRWDTIVNDFYPGLLEKYNGRMYDYWKNGDRRHKGAIGALKDALAGADTEMLKALRNGGNIPPTLHLPLEIDGVKLVVPDKITKGDVSGNGSTKLKEAGTKTTTVNVKTVETSGRAWYLATDLANNGTGSGATQEQAIANLAKMTGKTYLEDDIISYTTDK